jgi:hypothetical protein
MNACLVIQLAACHIHFFFAFFEIQKDKRITKGTRLLGIGSDWLRAGRSGRSGSIPGRGEIFFLQH